MYLGAGGGAVLEQDSGPVWVWPPAHGQQVWGDPTLEDLIELGPELVADARLKSGERWDGGGGDQT